MWLNSPSHCENLEKNWRQIGLSVKQFSPRRPASITVSPVTIVTADFFGVRRWGRPTTWAGRGPGPAVLGHGARLDGGLEPRTRAIAGGARRALRRLETTLWIAPSASEGSCSDLRCQPALGLGLVILCFSFASSRCSEGCLHVSPSPLRFAVKYKTGRRHTFFPTRWWRNW